jgi:NADPH:quinone reductase-like Zn-dependent oxidoreductase
MKQSLIVSKHGSPQVLKLIEQPSEPMGPDDVRIGVKAAGVNFADIVMRMGMYLEAPPPPFTPGYEVAGVVSEIGANVSSHAVGDRVIAGTHFGGYTTEVVVPRHVAWKMPDDMSYIEGAAIPVNFLTAWVALHEMARVREGDRVLIQSAAGGVGIAAVQIAKQAGALVTGLVGSAAKSAAVLSHGAEQILTNEEWERADRNSLQPFDIILDSNGGASLKRDLRRLKPAGRIVSFGLANMIRGRRRSILRALNTIIHTPLFTPIGLMKHNSGVYGLNMLPLFAAYQSGKSTLIADCFEQILQNFAQGKFKVVIGKTFPLAEGAAAHEYLQSRANIGKVVLEC